MAEIPVERKQGGLPWWLIPLLLLLVLIPLLFLFSRGCNEINTNTGNANRSVINTTNTANANGTAIVANTNSNATAGSNTNVTNSGAAVTDISYFAGVSDKNSLVGRSVDLKNVKVDRVLSDHVFTVKSGSSEMFVYLDESQDSGGGKEQQIKITPGQELNLSGDFRRVPNAETANEKNEKQTGGLTDAEYAQMKGQQVYLHGVSQ